jgi:hypothetical protein
VGENESIESSFDSTVYEEDSQYIDDSESLVIDDNEEIS